MTDPFRTPGRMRINFPGSTMQGIEPMKKLIKISEFSDLAGVSLQALRTWDRLGYLPCDSRGLRGERLYREEQIEIARGMFGRIKKPLERAPRYSKTPKQRAAV